MENANVNTAPGFDPVLDIFEENFTIGDGELGAGFAAYLDGELVVDITAGWADRKKTRAFDGETLTPVYSTTKGIAALVMADLVAGLEDSYETTVASIWPAFGAAGKEAITIGQLLSHQAGLPGFAEEIDPELWLDPPACAAALAALPPMWPPGTAHGYHPLSWGYLVGEIALRISGETLGATLAKTYTEHGKSHDFWIGLPSSEHHRCADNQRPKQLPDLGDLNTPTRTAFMTPWSAAKRGGAIWREIEIPSANGHGTAKAVAALYGHYLTARPDVTRQRVHGQDLVLPLETSFGAGIMRNSHGLFGPNPETLGHSGWGGSMAIADPARGLSCGYVMNRQSNVLVGDPRAVRLVEAVYGCL